MFPTGNFEPQVDSWSNTTVSLLEALKNQQTYFFERHFSAIWVKKAKTNKKNWTNREGSTAKPIGRKQIKNYGKKAPAAARQAPRSP